MKTGTVVSYRVFVRDWWRRPGPGEPSWQGKVPYPGAPKRTLARHCTEDEARNIAAEYNDTHKAGWRSRKAEYESE